MASLGALHHYEKSYRHIEIIDISHKSYTDEVYVADLLPSILKEEPKFRERRVSYTKLGTQSIKDGFMEIKSRFGTTSPTNRKEYQNWKQL